ncbi:MAG: hypothetical protein ACOC2A_03830 [Halanaeroarchaeum sp.]
MSNSDSPHSTTDPKLLRRLDTIVTLLAMIATVIVFALILGMGRYAMPIALLTVVVGIFFHLSSAARRYEKATRYTAP